MIRLLQLLGVLLALAAGPAPAETYLSPEAFVSQAFDARPPAAQILWFSGDLRSDATTILGHAPPALRTRYWQQDGKTAWVLEEIGKEAPITTGLVIEDGALRQIRVLVYRESRGWEVRHDFFTHQFEGARLNPSLALDKPIDNISGATLSVQALQKLARLALRLDRAVRSAGAGAGAGTSVPPAP